MIEPTKTPSEIVTPAGVPARYEKRHPNSVTVVVWNPTRIHQPLGILSNLLPARKLPSRKKNTRPVVTPTITSQTCVVRFMDIPPCMFLARDFRGCSVRADDESVSWCGVSTPLTVDETLSIANDTQTATRWAVGIGLVPRSSPTCFQLRFRALDIGVFLNLIVRFH